MAGPLRVGIIGANARGGWAGISHVPAVQGLAGLVLAAVAANSQGSADQAAEALNVSKAYASGTSLIADPDIDVVTVATRVPDHRALVMAALSAGKHVYCEWPLERGSAESDEIARAAQAAGVHHVIGLQLRASPAVRAAQDRLASGGLGRLLSLSTFSSSAGFGPDVADPFVYLEDPAAFANLVTIQGAHTLDLIMALGGPLSALSALASWQFPEIKTERKRSVASGRPSTICWRMVASKTERHSRWKSRADARARRRSGSKSSARRGFSVWTVARHGDCSRAG
jgi:predicted dehydrogenase